MILPIPAIDIIGGKCVRLSQGDYQSRKEYDADPVDMVKRFADHGMSRVHVVDLDGAKASEPANLRLLERMALVDSAAIEWGGGIKSDWSLRDVFNAGASYAIIGSVAAKSPDVFVSWLQQYGPDSMVLGADVRDREVAVNGWLEQSQHSIDALIDIFVPHGLSQVVCTDIACDGMLQGPNFDLYQCLMQKYPDLVFTASGGIGSMDDIERLDAMGMPRVIIGKAIYEGKISLKQLEELC